MSSQNKKIKIAGYKLIGLCLGGLILGSVIPIYVHLAHRGTAAVYLAVMEIIGAAALVYVFSIHLLKK